MIPARPIRLSEPGQDIQREYSELYGRNPISNANDLRQHLISVDTRFRKTPLEPPTDCQYEFAHPYKNVIKARIASVEIPIGFYNFSKAKKNTMFRLDASDYTGQQHYLPITIPDGEYTPECLIKTIQDQMNAIRDTYGIFFRIIMDPISRRVTILHDGSASPPCPPGPSHCPVPFGITFMMVGLEEREYDFGLGYNLGFTKPFYTVESPYQITGESLMDTTGDKYFLLEMEDFNTVEHKTNDSYFQTMAKILVKRTPTGIIFDDGYTVLSNEIVFTKPRDLSNIRIRLLDAYGVPIDIHHLNYSISLEVWEVMNPQLYDHYRTYVWNQAEPRAIKQTNGSSAPIAPPARNYN